MTVAKPDQSIGSQERSRRLKAVNYARGSVRLEGFVLDEQTEALFARYVEGELNREELNAEVLKLAHING